jgi:hypothetical protein
MIHGDEARGGKNRRVSYRTVSGTRPWLAAAKDLRLTGRATNSSAEVEYTTASGETETAWVGFDFLTFVKSTHQDTIDSLLRKKTDLLLEIKNIEAAIKALENL